MSKSLSLTPLALAMALEDAWSILKNAPAPAWTLAQNQVQDDPSQYWQANTYPIQGPDAKGELDMSNVADPNQYTHSAPVGGKTWPAPSAKNLAPAGDWSGGKAVAQGDAPVAQIEGNVALDNMAHQREGERMDARANAIGNLMAATTKPGFLAGKKAREHWQRVQDRLAADKKKASSRASESHAKLQGAQSPTPTKRIIQRQPAPDVGVTSTSLFADNPLGPLAGDRT
tara:strand:+ start:1813 stop:2499 length:687 start_codon:yes stop_codon:yes gene_type:complete